MMQLVHGLVPVADKLAALLGERPARGRRGHHLDGPRCFPLKMQR